MARSKRTQLDSKLAGAEQEIRSATIMRDYTKISAPFCGYCHGEIRGAGKLAAPGAPLLTIEQEGAYRLEASVDESRLPFVKAGQTVDVALESLDRG
jgi:multidrug resistance efflux pump